MNSVCFAHGAKKSGKSHTIFGSFKGNEKFKDGLVWKVATLCLYRIPRDSRISISFLEICDEDLVRDLLIPPSSVSRPRSLLIREHPDHRGAFVKDLSETYIRSIDVLEVNNNRRYFGI